MEYEGEEEDKKEKLYKKKVEREDEYDEEGVFEEGRQNKHTHVPRMTCLFSLSAQNRDPYISKLKNRLHLRLCNIFKNKSNKQ